MAIGKSRQRRKYKPLQIRRGKVEKVKSIHATTPAQAKSNRLRNLEIEGIKKKRKDLRFSMKAENKTYNNKIVSWMKYHPLHPRTVQPSKQIETLTTPAKVPQMTYKAYVKFLPFDATGKEIGEHFVSKGINVHYVRLVAHRVKKTCLGSAFLEFENRIDYEKALNASFSLFGKNRIIVESTMGDIKFSKRTPCSLISYKPPPPSQIKLDDIEMKEIKDEGDDQRVPKEPTKKIIDVVELD